MADHKAVSSAWGRVAALIAAGAALPLISEMRIARPTQPVTDCWTGGRVPPVAQRY